MYTRSSSAMTSRTTGATRSPFGRSIASSPTGSWSWPASSRSGCYRAASSPGGEQEAQVAAEIERIAQDAGAEAEAFQSSSPARGLPRTGGGAQADPVVVGSSPPQGAAEILAGNVGLGLLHGRPAPSPSRRAATGIAPETGSKRSSSVSTDRQRPPSRLRRRLSLPGRRRPRESSPWRSHPDRLRQRRRAQTGAHELTEAIEELMRERLAQAQGSVSAGVDIETILVSGDPAQQLADAARADGSVLILGSRAYGRCAACFSARSPRS